MKDTIIIGAGTYGQVYTQYLKCQLEYKIIGYLDDDPRKLGTEILGIPIIGDTATLETIKDKNRISIFVPIGNNLARIKLIQKAKTLGFNTPSFIHPHTEIDKTVKIEDPVYILPSTNIMPFVEIGKYTMISMGVNIAHHTKIYDGVFISQGSNIGASVLIEDMSFVGQSSTIMTGVKRIGKNVLIGAGAVVIDENVKDNSVIAGVPAKFIKKNNVYE